MLTGLALALMVYAALSLWIHQHRAALVGLNERPCTAEGRPVTGSGMDDWAALCAWRQENRAVQRAGRRPQVVMIGDSLTEKWPASDPGVVLRGVGGQGGGQVLLRFRQDALDLDPYVIHIVFGTNDLLGLYGPFPLAQYEGRVLDMLELAQAHGQVVILGTIPPIRSYDGFGRRDPAVDVARINAALRRLARQRGAVLADYHAVLVRPDGSMREDLFESDGVHLLPAGYAAMQPVFETARAEALAKAGRQAGFGSGR